MLFRIMSWISFIKIKAIGGCTSYFHFYVNEFLVSLNILILNFRLKMVLGHPLYCKKYLQNTLYIGIYILTIKSIIKAETDFEQNQLLPNFDCRKATNCTQNFYYQTLLANCCQKYNKAC